MKSQNQKFKSFYKIQKNPKKDRENKAKEGITFKRKVQNRL